MKKGLYENMNIKNKLILLTENSEDVRELNRSMLEDDGFAVQTAVTLAEVRASAKQKLPDAIILDIDMPDGNGLDFLRELRKFSRVPVLLLSGLSEDIYVIKGFESGCNDYLTKPYTSGVLLVRLKNLLQSAEQVPEFIRRGSLFLDIQSGQAFAGGKDLLLTQKEFFLLLLFVQHEEQLINADHLYKKIWGQPMNKDTQAIKKAIHRLRSSLEDSGYTITVTRGKGYTFERV
ncbi:MAG: response regulator transcription factor [Oscillospiraceae bacterium]|jgi:DNA-binding response OmpR family regulator|nr:response regulator transcription factor [Oscillospiraceae bacterium]